MVGEHIPIRRAVAKGCLLGFVLAGSWGVFGLLLYALVTAAGGSLGLSVVCGAGGGPTIGSALFLWWWFRRHGRAL